VRVEVERLGDPLKAFQRRDRSIVLDVVEEADRDVRRAGQCRESETGSVPQVANSLAEGWCCDDLTVIVACDIALTLRPKRIRCQRMSKPPRRSDDFGFPAHLAQWLRDEDHERILLALAHLRDEPPVASAAVRLLLATSPVRKLKLSFELWEALIAHGEPDADAVLLAHLQARELQTVRTALWGDDPHPTPGARLRIIHLDDRRTCRSYETE
jgi:hypothetical protein